MWRLVAILSVLAVGGVVNQAGAVHASDGLLSTAAADAVRLRTTAIVNPGQVLLGQIADLEGSQSQALSQLVVAADVAQIPGGKVTLDTVMEIVHAAAAARRGEINAGRIAFHGGVCQVVRGTPEMAPAAKPEAVLPSPPNQVESIPESATVRGAIAERLPGMLGLDASRVRLTFDEADRRLLAGSVQGSRLDLKILAIADRLPVQVLLYQEKSDGGYTLGTSSTIRIGVEVERAVVAAIAPMKRGDVIDSNMVTSRTEWLPLTRKPIESADVAGSVVKGSKLAAGAALLAGDVEPAIVIRKGQITTVHCVSGPFIVKTQARALEAGRVGQTIKFAPMDVRDRKDTRSFSAQVETAGRAIMSVGGQTAEAGR